MPQQDDNAGFRSTLAFAGRRLLPIVIAPSEFAGDGRASGAARSPGSRGSTHGSHNDESAQSTRARAAAVATYEMLATIDDASARCYLEHRQ